MSRSKIDFDGQTVEYETLVDLKCQFCGGQVSVINIFEDENDEDPTLCAMHSVPECREFTVLEAREFLRQNREVKKRNAN